MVTLTADQMYSRVLERVEETTDGHWLWTGRMRGKSPTISVPGSRTMSARRVVAAHDIDPTFPVRCETPGSPIVVTVCGYENCVAPEHLEIADRKGALAVENCGMFRLEIGGTCASGLHDIVTEADIYQGKGGRRCRKCKVEHGAARHSEGFELRKKAAAIGLCVKCQSEWAVEGILRCERCR